MTTTFQSRLEVYALIIGRPGKRSLRVAAEDFTNAIQSIHESLGLASGATFTAYFAPLDNGWANGVSDVAALERADADAMGRYMTREAMLAYDTAVPARFHERANSFVQLLVPSHPLDAVIADATATANAPNSWRKCIAYSLFAVSIAAAILTWQNDWFGNDKGPMAIFGGTAALTGAAVMTSEGNISMNWGCAYAFFTGFLSVMKAAIDVWSSLDAPRRRC